MHWRNTWYILGWMAWLAVGEPGGIVAQTLDPAIPATIRFSSAPLEVGPPIPSADSMLEFRRLYSSLSWSGCPAERRNDPCAFCTFAPSVDRPCLLEAGTNYPGGDSFSQPPRLGDHAALFNKETLLLEAPAVTRTPRLLLFRMPSGFLANPIGLENDDDSVGPDGKSNDDGLAGVQLSMGKHIPYLDMFRRGDPGGAGYYRIHSQVQIFDFGSSSLCVGLQALTPAGPSSEGLLNGPTTLMPALSCFQELYEGTALHAFIGQNLLANSRWRENLTSSFRCGLAVQQPLPMLPAGAGQGLFFFVQTLGEYRMEGYRSDVKTASWDVIPGLQWRMNDTCWMSLGISRYNFLSCAWQY